MSGLVSDTKIERFRMLYDQFQRDTTWQARLRQQDARREAVRAELLEFLHQYLSGQVGNDVFKATFNQKTHSVWEGFGLKGMSGAMFLNMLIKNIPDQQTLAQQLRLVFPVPPDEAVGQSNMYGFQHYIEGSVAAQW